MGRKAVLKLSMRKFLAIGLMIITIVSLFACTKGGDISVGAEMPIYSMYPGDLDMWEHIFKTPGEYKFESAPLGVIIPHHMIAAEQITKFYKGLSKVIDPKLVVVIGPNHYENGSANIQTCKTCLYKTEKGDTELNDKFINKMVDDGIADLQDDTFIKEHAIFSHTPFIKNFFPEAKIVPIVLQWEMPINEVLKLSEWLDENLPDDALVIASVDFSHYISLEAANFHDRSAFVSISNFDFENIYDLEVDSPSSIYLILDLMKRRGFKRAERLEHTNLDQFLSKPSYYSTSHQYFAFYEGDIERVDGMSVMLLNGIANLGVVDNWNWDRAVRKTEDDVLYYLRGEEDRFLTGSDYLIFDFECHDLEQNGMKIKFCPADLPIDLKNAIAGIYITPDEYEITLFPYEMIDGRARLTDKKIEVVKIPR